jgi:nucleoside-diphosphate-sugar epimerase
VDDVVEAFVLAGDKLKRLFDGGWNSYAISSCQSLTLKALVMKREEASGKSPNVDWGGRPYRPREVMVPWSSKNERLPGWRYKITLNEGLKRCLEEFTAAVRNCNT